MSLLTDFRLSVLENNLGVYGIHVHQNGSVLAQHRFRSDDRENLYSASKTFTAIGVGIAEAEGLLKLTDPVLSFFPEYASIASEGTERIQIRDLLHMSTGHAEEKYRLKSNADRAKLFFETPMVHPVGAQFFYENSATYMLGRIIEKLSGQILLEYLKPRLFNKLEILNPQWQICAMGHTSGSGGLYLTTEEFSRLGVMLLNEGNYGEHQIVPSDFIHRMHTDLVPTLGKDDPETRAGYGYQVWNCTIPNTYRADGMYGQMCVVLRDYNAVITVTAHNETNHKDILRAIWSEILPKL